MKFNFYASTLPILIGLALVTLVSGCISSKQLVYFQGQPAVSDSIKLMDRFVPTVQPGDILSVRVSSLSPEATSFFNPPSATVPIDRMMTPITTSLPEITGYLVNPDGTLELPLIGKVPVGGLTTAQAADRIREQLKTYLKEPTWLLHNSAFYIGFSSCIS